jgi:uncharacterized protein (DUF305 family)
MTGMMSSADMSALNDASAAAAGKLYLTQMIQHHEGAIEMARSEVAKGKNSDVMALAERIISSQSAEIAQMKGMLASL